MKKIDKSEKLISTIKNFENIPTLKSIRAKILKIINVQEDVPITKLSNIVKSDMSIAARILRIVNSPFYGFANKITSIENALVLLGFNTVKSILISLYVYENAEFENTLKGLFGHSLFSAIVAMNLSKKISATIKTNKDDIFSASLLHDIGRVVLVIVFPEELEKIFKKSQSEKIPLSRAEKDILGINHDIIGSMLLKEWGFPEAIYAPVNFHHNPISSGNFKIESTIIHISDILANALGVGLFGDQCLEPIDHKYLSLLSIDGEFLQKFIYEIYPLQEELSFFNN